MKPKWLLEKDVFNDNQDKLIETLKAQGIEYQIIPYIPFDDEIVNRCLKIYGPDECVVFYGSLNFGRKLRKGPWVPGVYLNERAFECTSYYPVLAYNLIHHNYIMMPYGDLMRRKHELYKYFNSDKIFLRPNSGNKQFTGMVVDIDDYEECIKLAGFYDVEPDLLVVVSDVALLDKEWRFVVVNQEIVSGSLYRDWSKPEKLSPGIVTKDYVLMRSHSVAKKCEDAEAFRLARLIALKYNPDICYTIDIAQEENGFYGVLEVGCFSCAGLYGNDLDTVVKKVSEAAVKEWTEYNPK